MTALEQALTNARPDAQGRRSAYLSLAESFCLLGTLGPLAHIQVFLCHGREPDRKVVPLQSWRHVASWEGWKP